MTKKKLKAAVKVLDAAPVPNDLNFWLTCPECGHLFELTDSRNDRAWPPKDFAMDPGT